MTIHCNLKGIFLSSFLTLIVVHFATFSERVFHNSAFAQSEYDKLRNALKDEEPKNPQSYITSSVIGDPDFRSLREHQNEIKEDCERNPESSRCSDYRRILSNKALVDVCEANPLDRHCKQRTDSEFNKMMKRQSACRGGYESRGCRNAKKMAIKSGLISSK